MNHFKMWLYENEHFEKRLLIEDSIKNKEQLPFEQMVDKVMDVVNEFNTGRVNFAEITPEQLENIYNVGLCTRVNIDKQEPFCMVDGDVNKLIVPKTNLHSDFDNEEKYTQSLVYDLMMNTSVQNKIIKSPQMIVEDVYGYDMHENEFMILETLLDGYYKNLRASRSNYEKSIAHDNIEPESMMHQ